jgi:hypothetical protein
LPLQAKINGYLDNPGALQDILNAGQERAAVVANTKITQVKERLGLKL